MKVPGQSEVEAAWHALPAETRDRIGIIAVDLVFQAFVHGDAYVATGSPRDRAVPGHSKAAQAIRNAAGEAENRRLNELHRVVECVLPDLFGPEGENPDWAESPARPSPVHPRSDERAQALGGAS
ncbi:hypothetical protein [Methylobacterium sp. Leaf112]|uniref:hypothetical protein n=1 Tax=Methylobacterium sp. Leaf112 TaxID=1736258 RepID=UPI0006F7038E|nr:hypothetical protein [Methylobacterium sp. Leaf112]KQP60550.1 hypothetical protein ASF52_09590 [Methylobacterium sp. Leaf112]